MTLLHPERKNNMERSLFVQWVKRLGLLGLLFFSIKGLLWLLLTILIIWWSGIMRV
jgi:hypothetical protein